MRSLFKGALVLAAAALIAGCSSSRQSTTPRTAIEQALISQSAEFAMAKFADPNLEGKTFSFDTRSLKRRTRDSPCPPCVSTC